MVSFIHISFVYNVRFRCLWAYAMYCRRWQCRVYTGFSYLSCIHLCFVYAKTKKVEKLIWKCRFTFVHKPIQLFRLCFRPSCSYVALILGCSRSQLHPPHHPSSTQHIYSQKEIHMPHPHMHSYEILFVL